MHAPSRRPRWPWRGLGLLALVLLLGASLTPLPAQKDKVDKDDPPVQLKSRDLSLVAASGCGYLALAANELLEHPLLKHLPARARENFQELERELPAKIGVAPRQLRRLVVAFPQGGMTGPVVLLMPDKPLSAEAIQKNLGSGWKEDKGDHGRLLRNDRGEVVQFQQDGAAMLFGREKDVNAFLDRANGNRPEPTLVRGLGSAEGGAHLVVGVRPDDLVGMFWLGGAAPPPAMKAVPKTQTKEATPIEKGSGPPTGPGGPPPGVLPGTPGGPPGGPPGLPGGPPPGGDPFAVVAVQPDHDHGPERPSLNEILKDMPPHVLPFKPLMQCKAAVFALRLGDDTATATLSLGYNKADQVEDAQASLRVGLYVLREVLPRWWLEEVGLNKENAVEVVRSLDKMVEAIRKVEVRVAGRTVEATATLPTDAATVGVLLREMQFNGLSTERANNLKQVGLAIHNYHDVMGAMPGSAYYSAQGKPLLSWRVAILPYIEQENLYRQFKLDEPWDGPNNIKLLDKMPKIYAPPASVRAEAGHTFLQGFSGPGTIFDPMQDRKQAGQCMGVRLTAITDGTSNTAMVGESGKAVPWTKPEDIPCDFKTVPLLGCVPGSDRCLVLMGDGSVATITTKPARQSFFNMVGRQDGNIFSIDELKPGRPRPPEDPQSESRPVPPRP